MNVIDWKFVINVISNKESIQQTLMTLCVTTQNPRDPHIREIISESWDILGKTKTL